MSVTMNIAANSPPVPRFEIDRNILTKPVPIRGTPVATSNCFRCSTPETRTAMFSPKAAGGTIATECSAFKPIQSPILNEQSESVDTKSTVSGKKLCHYHRFRHRARSFVTDFRATVSSPQLKPCDNSLRRHVMESENIKRARSFSVLISSSQHHQWDDNSSCGDYSDLDVAEIEIN